MALKVGIIGGGVMGLTLGYRLAMNGCKVQIFESREQIGGLSTWMDYGDFVWDKYYHVILQQDSELLTLIQELGIHDRLRWTATSTGFLWRKQFLSMSNYWEFLTFPALNLPQKIRLGFGILYSHYLQNPKRLEGMTAKEWLIKTFGRGVFSAIWEPLLESKFGVLKETVPAFLLWATISRYYGTRSKTSGKEWMGYLSGGGLKVLIDRLTTEIQDRGGEISCGEKAVSVSDSGSMVQLETDKGAYQFDRLISTIPTVLFQRLFPGFGEKSSSKGPEFLGVIRLALLLKNSLSPYYVTNLIDKNLPYTGIIELSRVVDKEELGHKNLVMLPRYDVPSSEWFRLTDEEITDRFMASMKLTWPMIESDVVQSFVHRESIVQAVWMHGSPATEPQTTSDKRIWSINAELAGYDNLNNNAIVRVANASAAKFFATERHSCGKDQMQKV